jgi:hypothetical protein
MADRNELGQFVEGNTASKGGPPGNAKNLRHGGASAVEAIRQGEPFTGLAAGEERSVREELQASGRAELVRQEAIRLKTACNLYWGAVCKAADDGNLETLDRYVKRYGWLAGATLRAWAQLGDVEREEAETLDYSTVLERLGMDDG